MRNLKRALSMLLSSTMVLGMVAMGGSAAGYQDVDDTYNKEAIEVLQAVGIMTGDENGNFAPETTVTRNQMAVIMANLMAYNVASYAGTSPFTDVPSWAEPYVAACWTNGITAGIGDNLYGGDQEVTTAQAALMIMKALGYFQYQSDFGGDWQLSTVTQGNKIDLFNDVDSGVKAAMTRNDVAQLVLNGLEAGMVEADDNTLNVTTPDGTVVEAGRVTYNYVTSGQDYAVAIDDVLWVNGNATDVSTAGSIVQLGEKLYQGSLKKDETVRDYQKGTYTYVTDAFGRPATRWEYQSKEIGVYTEAADHSFSGKVTAKDLYNAVGATAASTYDWYVSVDDNTPTLYANGLPNLSANKTDTVKEVMELTLGDVKDKDGNYLFNGNGTGNGVRTEVFVDAVNGTVFLSLTHYYAAEVYTVDEENGMTTLSDLGSGAPGHKLSDEFETTDFEEGQIVAYSYVNGEIQEIFPTTQVEGTVTATRVETENNADSNGDYYIVDGTKYNYNWSVLETDRLETENVNNNMVGYLDQYGYTIYIDEAAVSYDYAYVLSMGASHDTYGDKDYVWSARMVLTDGTVVSVETDAKDGDLAKHIVSYTVDKNGIYTLSNRSAFALADIAKVDVNNGVASFQLTTDNDAKAQYYTANSSTVFIVADSADKISNYDFTVYTGVKNMPNIDELANTKATVAVGDGNIAKVVYIQDADVSGVHNVYFVRANVNAKLVSDSELGRYREIAAVVDGEVTTLKVKEGSTAEKILCGGSTNVATALTELADGEGVYLDKVGEDGTPNGKDRIIALESINYNADGLVTNVHTYDALNTQMNGYKVTVDGTDKSAKETVMLGGTEKDVPITGIRYAWYDDVTVVRWNYYAGEFSVSTINSVKYDENDRTLAVLSENVLNGLCIVEFKDGEDDKVVQPAQLTMAQVNAALAAGDFEINGNFTLTDTLELNGHTLTVNGDLYLNGQTVNSAIPGGNVFVNGTIYLGSTINSGVTITANAAVIKNDVTINGTLVVENDGIVSTAAEGTSYTITMNDAASVLKITGDVAADIETAGTVFITGSLTGDVTTQAGADVTVTGTQTGNVYGQESIKVNGEDKTPSSETDPGATEFTVTFPAEGVTVTDKATGAAIASGDKVAKDAVITVTPAEGYTVKVGNETVPAEGKDYPVTGSITITATKDGEVPPVSDLENAPVFDPEKDFDAETNTFTLRVLDTMKQADLLTYIRTTLNNSGKLPEGVTIGEVIPSGGSYQLWNKGTQIEDVTVDVKIVYAIALDTASNVKAYVLAGDSITVANDITVSDSKAGDYYIAVGDSKDSGLPQVDTFGEALTAATIKTYIDAMDKSVVLTKAVSVTADSSLSTSGSNFQYKDAEGAYQNFTSGYYVAVGTEMKVVGTADTKGASVVLMDGNDAVADTATTVTKDGEAVTYTFSAGTKNMSLSEKESYSMTIDGKTQAFTYADSTISFTVPGSYAETAPLAGTYIAITNGNTFATSKLTVAGTYNPAAQGFDYTISGVTLTDIDDADGNIVLKKAVSVTLGTDGGATEDTYFTGLKFGGKSATTLDKDTEYFVAVDSAVVATSFDVYKSGTLAVSYTGDDGAVTEPVTSIASKYWGVDLTLVMAKKDATSDEYEAMETAGITAIAASSTDLDSNKVVTYAINGEAVDSAGLSNARVAVGDTITITYKIGTEAGIEIAGDSATTTAGKVTFAAGTGAELKGNVVVTGDGSTVNTVEGGVITFKIPSGEAVTLPKDAQFVVTLTVTAVGTDIAPTINFEVGA